MQMNLFHDKNKNKPHCSIYHADLSQCKKFHKSVVKIWELRDIFKSILSKEVKNISATVWEPLSTFSQNVTKKQIQHEKF